MAMITFFKEVEFTPRQGYLSLDPQVITWLEAHGGQAVAVQPEKHFVTKPGHWYYERHPRSDVGQSRATEKAKRDNKVYDVFSFLNPNLAMLFKLTWL